MKEKDEHCSRAGQKMTKAKFTFSLKLLLWGFKIQTQRQSRLNQIKWTSLIFFFDVFQKVIQMKTIINCRKSKPS